MVAERQAEADRIRAELRRREQREVLAELATSDDGFPEFSRYLWEEAQPGRPCVWGTHPQQLCEATWEFLGGDERVMVVNVPPRTAKSTEMSVLLPAALWLHDPSLQFLCVTKSVKNTRRDARAMRRVVSSDDYQALARRLGTKIAFADDQNQVEYYANTEGGHRISIPVDGNVIGSGADLLIVDDPHDAADVLGSPEQVASAMDYAFEQLESVWERRLNPGERPQRKLLRTAKVLVVMQRLHDRDLAGRCLARGAASIILPMEAESPPRWARDQRREGELLVPRSLFGESDEAAARANPAIWAGQYQQRPTPREGGLFKAHYFQRRWTPADLGRLSLIVISIDATFKDTKASDYCVLQTLGRTRAPLLACLLDQVRRRMDYPALRDATRQAVADARRRWPGVPLVVLVEDKANGSALVADMVKEIPGVIAYNPGTRSKYERAQVGSVPWFEAGQFALPPEGTWADEKAFVLEHLSFPRAANDDQVDAGSQGLLYLAQQGEPQTQAIHGPARRNMSEAPADPFDDGPSDRARSRRPRVGSRRGGW